MSHARLAPSGADRWITCPASVSREEQYPDTTSEAADWGTAAHAILEAALLTATHPKDINLDDTVVSQDEPHEYAPEYRLIHRWGADDLQEMRDTAAVAYDYVQGLLIFGATVKAESKVHPGRAIGRDDCFGTADVTVLSHDNTWLEVIDLKGGRGVVVEPDTAQLKLYGLGALIGVPLEGTTLVADPAQFTIRLTIVQPRAPHTEGPIRTLVTSAADLYNWSETVFEPAALETDNPLAVAVPSEKGCRFCRAKGACPEYSNQAAAVFQTKFLDAKGASDRNTIAAALTEDPDKLPLERIAFILEHEALITGWLKAVRDYAMGQANQGVRIPGFKLAAGRSSRKWTEDPDALFERFKGLTKQDRKKITRADLFTESFISPAQAEKRLKSVLSKQGWEIMEGYIATMAGSPTLVPETDSRPEINRDYAAVLTAAENPLGQDFFS